MAHPPIKARNINFKTFGNWLRQRRKFAGLNQEEAAQLAEISRGYWSQIEKGEKKRRPSRETLLKMIDAVNGDQDEALQKMAYPIDKPRKAFWSAEGDPSKRLGKAIKDFKEILLSARSETEAAPFLMFIYRKYQGRNWGPEYADAANPVDYQGTLANVMQLDVYRMWLIARAVLLFLEAHPSALRFFPKTHENAEYNREQRRIIRFAASIKERQIEETQKYEQKKRQQKKTK